jgi:hypothetical protein
MIYRRFGLIESQHFLSIRAQYNTTGASAYHFYLIPIRDEVEWQMIFEMANAEMNWRVVELYVEILSNDDVGLFSNNLPETSNRIPTPIISASRDNQMFELDS